MQIHIAQVSSWDFHTQQNPAYFNNGIQIWLLSLDDCPLTEREYALFSAEELQKAGSYTSSDRQMCYLKGHLLIKRIGAHFSGIPEASLILKTGTHGKPGWELPLSFNLSHSGKWIAAAFSFSYEVGIDLEQEKKTPHPESFVHRFFHPDEAKCWETAPADEKETLFFRYWTMKEALLKGTGNGLSVSTRDFCLTPQDPSNAVWKANHPLELYSSWCLSPFHAPDGFIGSVAYRVLKN